MKSGRAVAHGDAVAATDTDATLHATVSRPFLFERGHLRTKDIGARRHDSRVRAVELIVQFLVCRTQIEERDLCHSGSNAAAALNSP